MFKITCLIIFFLTLTVQRINTVNGESLCKFILMRKKNLINISSLILYSFTAFQMLTGSSCAKHCKFECKPDEAAMAKCNGKDCQCWSIGKTGGSINRIIKSCE